ncbi:MAG: S8 family serine peptidase, partial [Pseudomonadota bacterium]
MEKMIILTVNRPLAPSLRRTPVSAAGGGARGVAAMGGGANAAKESAETLAEMKVESADLNASEQADLAHNPNVAAAARDMPIKLIEPAKRDTLAGGDVVATPCSVTPTWGIEAVGAASDDFTGAGVRVAVLDTGIDEDHDAFAGIPLSQFSGTNPNGNYRDFTGEGFADTDGHGTHCAGTIFGRDVNGNRIGVARGINDIVIAKVLGANGGDTAIMVEALHWA